VLDVVDVAAGPETEIDLPLHPLPGVDSSELTRTALRGSSTYAGHAADIAAASAVTPPDDELRLLTGTGAFHVSPRSQETLYVVEAPGPPSLAFAEGPVTPFIVRRASGTGRWVQVYAGQAGGVARVSHDASGVVVHHQDGTRDEIRLRDRSCTINCEGERGKRRLKGWRSIPPAAPKVAAAPARVVRCPTVHEPVIVGNWDAIVPEAAVLTLQQRDYRRSESEYATLGRFRARIAVFTQGTKLYFGVDVMKHPRCFRPEHAPDPALDNEPPDIHSDGVQCYLDWHGWSGYLLVPEEGRETMRVAVVNGTAGDGALVAGWWRATGEGYRALVAIELGRPLAVGERVPVNVVVNEMHPGRMRRAGQLALSGGGGWVYLRGDREPLASAVLAEVQ
jgi:hypothetical protein